MFRSVLLAARGRTALTIAVGLAAASVLGVVGGVSAAGDSLVRPVAGVWDSLRRVTGPACQSPIGLCTEGTLGGVINGTYSFTGTTLFESGDTPLTHVRFFTGDLIVTTDHGQFNCKEAAVYSTNAGGPISSICTFVSGTGDFAGVTGALQFVGNGTAATGSPGGGNYVGELVIP